MKTNTLTGIVVLAFVVAGVLWARGYRVAGPDLAPSQRSLEARVVKPGGTAVGTAGTEAALPDITTTDGVADLGELRVVLSIAPRPPVAFSRHFYRVRVESNGAAARLENGRISFEMKMPMGDHRYSLVPGADGWQEAVVVLPFCASGNPRWYAIVEGVVDGRPVAARFRVDLTKPGSARP